MGREDERKRDTGSGVVRRHVGRERGDVETGTVEETGNRRRRRRSVGKGEG